MKKLVIITDGSRLRSFRLSDRMRGNDLSFHCTELGHVPEPAGTDAQGEEVLEALADRISQLVDEEQPAMWNLAGPRDLLDPVTRWLHPDARARLTRTHVWELMEASLTEIALRFPPTPCQSAPPARRPSLAR